MTTAFMFNAINLAYNSVIYSTNGEVVVGAQQNYQGVVKQLVYHQEVIKETLRECEELFINDEVKANYEYNI